MNRPFIKICGITNYSDALEVCKCGGDAVGFVTYRKSRRFVSPVEVKTILDKIKAYKNVFKVGVFVNASVEEILSYLDVGINVIQLHGDETAEYIRGLQTELRFSMQQEVEIWKAARLDSRSRIENIGKLPVDKVLLDTFVVGEYGGTGRTGDWDLAKYAVENIKKPVILAGGLNCENITDAVMSVSPFGVDISSGVEKEPGIKDHKLIEKLLTEKF